MSKLQRKNLLGLFFFPLLIAVGMVLFLFTCAFFTAERETPESLVAGIRAGAGSGRWQKAFELSNELNRTEAASKDKNVMREIIDILESPARYDPQTRAYMASALSHFREPEAIRSLRLAMADEHPDVVLHAMWSLGVLGASEAAEEMVMILRNKDAGLRKMAAYLLGELEAQEAVGGLKQALADPVDDVAWNAALSLARLGDSSGRQIISGMLDRQSLASQYALSPDAVDHIMINAAKGLALLGDMKSYGTLEGMAQSDDSPKVRQAALEALKYLDYHSGASS